MKKLTALPFAVALTLLAACGGSKLSLDIQQDSCTYNTYSHQYTAEGRLYYDSPSEVGFQLTISFFNKPPGTLANLDENTGKVVAQSPPPGQRHSVMVQGAYVDSGMIKWEASNWPIDPSVDYPGPLNSDGQSAADAAPTLFCTFKVTAKQIPYAAPSLDGDAAAASTPGFNGHQAWYPHDPGGGIGFYSHATVGP